MIQKIKLVNWKSHENTVVEIGPGTSTILGIMGSGKSSILQSIVFALYGDLPSLREKKAKLDDLIMSKPLRKNNAEVEVTFGAKGEWWTVKRKIERDVGTTYAEIRKNDMLIESGPAKVTDYISNLLDVNFDLFTKAVYAKQNEIDYFLTLPKGKRMEKIDELLNLDKLEDSRQLLSSSITKIRGSVGALEGVIKHKDPDSMKKQLSELESSISEIQQKLNFQKTELQNKRESLSELQTSMKELEEQKKELDQLEKEHFSLEQKKRDYTEKLNLLQMFSDILDPTQKLQTLTERRSRVIQIKQDQAKFSGEKETLIERKARLDEQLSELPTVDINELNSKKGILENNLNQLKSLIEDMDRKLLENPVQKLQGELMAINKEHQVINKELMESSGGSADKLFEQLDQSVLSVQSNFRSLGKLEGMGKPQDVIDRAFRMAQASDTELRKNINKFAESGGSKSKADELRKKEQELRKRIEELKQRYDLTNREFLESKALIKNKKIEQEMLQTDLSGVFEQIAKVGNIKNIRDEQELIIKKLSEIESKLSGIELPNLDEIENEMERVRKAVEFQDLKKELDQVMIKCTSVDSKIKLSGFDSERYSQLQKQKEELIQQISSIKTKIDGDIELLSEKDKLKQNISSEIKELEENVTKLKKEKLVVERAQILQNALKDAQEILRKEFVNTVNLSMSSVWEMLYPYQDYLDIRLNISSEGMKRGDYNLQLEDRKGSWITVDLASGGERSMACLALRIAFVKVLVPNFKLLVLDEPTHNLDSRGVEELANALRERVSNLLEQVLVITHDEKLEKAVTGSCFRLIRDKARDQPTKILEI